VVDAKIGPPRHGFISPKLFVPLVLIGWLLLSLAFVLLIPPAGAQTTGSCSEYDWNKAMENVYNPQRFDPRYSTCQSASGTVTHSETWGDGDWNIYVKLDSGSRHLVSRPDISHLRYWTQCKKTKTHEACDMLWEVVPGDDQSKLGVWGQDRKGNYLPPPKGTALQVWGAHVYDSSHMYKELHRLYGINGNWAD
jgi:hypothetical protein